MLIVVFTVDEKPKPIEPYHFLIPYNPEQANAKIQRCRSRPLQCLVGPAI